MLTGGSRGVVGPASPCLQQTRGDCRVLGPGWAPGHPEDHHEFLWQGRARPLLPGHGGDTGGTRGGHAADLAQVTPPIGRAAGHRRSLRGRGARTPTRPRRAASWARGGRRRPAGAGRRCGRAGGWFGPARTPPRRAAGCSLPWGGDAGGEGAPWRGTAPGCSRTRTGRLTSPPASAPACPGTSPPARRSSSSSTAGKEADGAGARQGQDPSC